MKKIYVTLLGAGILLSSCQMDEHKSQNKTPSENQEQEPEDNTGKRNE